MTSAEKLVILENKIEQLEKDIEILKCNFQLLMTTKNTSVPKLKHNRAAEVYRQAQLKKIHMLKELQR
jgi:hypothetical protein